VGCFFAICPKAHTWNGDGRLQRSHLGEMLVSASTCVLALQDYNTAAAHHCSGLEWEGPGGTYTYPGLGGQLNGLIHHQCQLLLRPSGTALHLAGALTAACALIHTSREALLWPFRCGEV